MGLLAGVPAERSLADIRHKKGRRDAVAVGCFLYGSHRQCYRQSKLRGQYGYYVDNSGPVENGQLYGRTHGGLIVCGRFDVSPLPGVLSSGELISPALTPPHHAPEPARVGDPGFALG